METSYIAIIPARKGSKRLPNKNTLPLSGKPLIAWAIDAALASKYINKVVVSTDSDEIADIAKKYGAEVPFVRPDYLSNDTASSVDVIKHCIDYYSEKGEDYCNIILLQPTSPLRTSIHIDDAIKMQIDKNADSVTSVCEMEHSPLWSNVLPSDNSMDNFIRPEVEGKRSQDLPSFYRLNGAIYIVTTQLVMTKNTLFSKNNGFAFKMTKKNSVDIDDEFDFKIAESLM